MGKRLKFREFLSKRTGIDATITGSVAENKTYDVKIKDCFRYIRIDGTEEDVDMLETIRDNLTKMIDKIKEE